MPRRPSPQAPRRKGNRSKGFFRLHAFFTTLTAFVVQDARRSPPASPRPERIARAECVGLSTLSLFGLFAVTAMLVCYALEHRSRWFILAFAGACALGSVYGFLQGAWPFGLVEAVWSIVALRRWRAATRSR